MKEILKRISIQLLKVVVWVSLGMMLVQAQNYGVQDVPNVVLTDSLRLTSDPGSILPEGARRALDERLVSLRRAYGVEASVVLLPSIGGRDIDSFANELFRSWGIGHKKDHTGLLILLVLEDRKLRIEVGYGLEGVLTDAHCAQIQRRVMVPQLRRGDYAAALLRGVEAIDETLKAGYDRPVRAAGAREGIDPIALVVCYLVFVALAFAWFTLEQQRQIERAAGPHAARLLLPEIERSFGRALWIFLILCAPLAIILYIYRYRARRSLQTLAARCAHCTASPVRQLAPAERMRYLSSGDVAEERLGSAYHRVYLCPGCQAADVVSDINSDSPATPCPGCGYRTLVAQRPYRVGHSLVRLERVCLHCGHRDHKDGRLQDESSATGDLITGAILAGLWGSARSRGGSFGSGWGSGELGGGSFGGGSSGGGGATSDW